MSSKQAAAKSHDHPREPQTLRRCLKCRELFSSKGSHNRICERCKKTRTWHNCAIARERS